MKYFIAAILSLCVFKKTSAQKIHVATANLERLKYKSGVILLYYGENRVIRNCYPYSVKLDKDQNEESIANQLRSKIAAYDPYIYFEFKEGFDCKSAEGYLLKKGLSRMSIGGCQYANFSTETTNSGKEPDGEIIDFSKEDYVANIPAATVNQLKSYFKNEHNKLLADGWVRFTSKYEYVPYKYDQFNMGGRRGYAYTLVLVSSDTNAVAYVNEFSNGVNLLQKKLGPNEYAIYYNLESFSERRRFEGKVESSNGSKIPVGVICYKKPIDFSKSIQQVLNSAKEGFVNLRHYTIGKENGKETFTGKVLLGHLSSTIKFNQALKVWEYTVFCQYGGDDADMQDKELKEFLEQKEKEGIYIVKKRKSADREEDIIEVFNSNGNLILATNYRSYTKKITWTFYEQK